VQPSTFNGFFRETKKAAYIETDKGILEVVFFDTNAAVEHIQITEAARGAPSSHVYVIKSADTTQRTEGAGATYFTKYQSERHFDGLLLIRYTSMAFQSLFPRERLTSRMGSIWFIEKRLSMKLSLSMQNRVEQIVGRERRERVSLLDSSGDA
jgi:hypothetical protein